VLHRTTHTHTYTHTRTRTHTRARTHTHTRPHQTGFLLSKLYELYHEFVFIQSIYKLNKYIYIYFSDLSKRYFVKSNLFYLCQCKCKGFLLNLITHNKPRTLGRSRLDEWSACCRGLYLHKAQQNQETDIHALGEIRTRDSSNEAA
jgi:hypothetical protein